MKASDLREALKQRPFEPICVGLSDGRSVIIRHPDQVVVSERKFIVGLAKVQRSRPLMTPPDSDTIAPDWMMVNLSQVTAVEPLDGEASS